MKTVRTFCLFTALLLMTSFSCRSQAFLKFAAGYGMPVAREQMGVRLLVENTAWTNEAIYSTLGGGLQAEVSGGFFLNGVVGLELGANLLLGSKIDAYDYLDDTTDVSSNETMKATQFRLNPSVIVRSSAEGSCFYVRAGLAIPVYSGLSSDRTTITDRNGDHNETVIQTDYKTSMSLGFQGGAGALIELSPGLALNLELNSTLLAARTKSSEIVQYTYNGEDQLSLLTTSGIQTNYVSELSSTSNFGGSVNPDAPSDALSTSMPFHSLALKVGLAINLN